MCVKCGRLIDCQYKGKSKGVGQCDKCGRSESAVGNYMIRKGLELIRGSDGMSLICEGCHNFKHELMNDPHLEKPCAFCKIPIVRETPQV